MLAEKNAEIGKAVAIIKRLSGDARERRIAEMQEMARRDEASRMNGAVRKEREKWERILAGRDATLADRDAALSEQAALIAELRARLGEDR
jgi:hypothetical protein